MCKKLTTEEFIIRASKIHKGKYSYQNSVYNKGITRIVIACPIHGDFEQQAQNHLRGVGCPKCGIEKAHANTKNSKNTILNKFKKAHGNKYKYPNIKFNTIRDKIEIICPTHGSFWQTIDSHIHSHGCPSCSNVKPHTKESFISKTSKIHNNKYDYSLVNYINNNTKIDIICPEHGIFSQTPRGHLTYGCPECHIRGYSKNKWVTIAEKNKNSYLYIIRCYNNNENFIKIGISSRALDLRFSSSQLPYNYEPIITFSNPPDMTWDFEKKLHNECKYYKYIPKIKFNGMYECFTIDVLNEICYLFCD